ncbi:hypothetical protein ACFQ0B_64225 [Nonomuraea thailandensis]
MPVAGSCSSSGGLTTRRVGSAGTFSLSGHGWSAESCSAVSLKDATICRQTSSSSLWGVT